MLQVTSEMMNSKNYKDRFIAEYFQVKIRLDKLKEMLKKWDEDNLDFFPTCPRSTYDMQVEAMTYYKNVLEARAKMEQIVLVLPVEC